MMIQKLGRTVLFLLAIRRMQTVAVAALICSVVVLGGCGAPDPAALLESGRKLEQQGDRTAAIIQFKAALQGDPNLLDARLALGLALQKQGDHDGALIELNRAIASGGEPRLIYPLIAQSLLAQGDLKRMVHTLTEVRTGDAKADAEVLADLALAWRGLGDMAKAEAALRKAMELEPGSIRARLRLVRLLLGRAEWERAQSLADVLVAEAPGHHEVLHLKAELQDLKGDREAASRTAAEVLKIDPSFVPAHEMLFRFRLQARDLDGARAQLEEMSRQVPAHPIVRLSEAQILLAEGKPELARQILQPLANVLVDNPTIISLTGMAEARAGALIQASTLLRKALTLNPGLVSVRVELAEVEIRLGQYNDALNTLRPVLAGQPVPTVALALASDAHLRLGQPQVSERLLRRAVELAPTNERLQTALLMRRMEQGEVAQSLSGLQSLSERSAETIADEALFAARLARAEHQAALEVLDRLQRKQPGNAFYAELRGRVHLARRELSEARGAFEQALKADPALFGAVASLVMIDQLENKYEDAVARVQQVVDRTPSNSVALVALAELKDRGGASYEEVSALFQRAARAAPLDAGPRLRLVELALRKRQNKQALTFAQEAQAALPGSPDVLDAAGRAQLRAGDVEQALTTFRAFASAMPGAALPHLRLAEVHRLQGRSDNAILSARRALELEPANEAAQGLLVDLLVSTRKEAEATAFVRRLRSLRPSDPAPYVLEAGLQERLRAPEAAIAVLREGVARTRSSQLAGLLFSLYVKTGRDADAARFGADWLRTHPADASFEYLMSVRDITRRDLTTAEQRLRRVVAVYTSNALALNNLAWVIVQQGGGGAVEFARRAVALTPDQPDYLDTLAAALALAGSTSDAIVAQKRAVELAPNDLDLQLNLARIALQAGDKPLARQHLEALRARGAAFRSQKAVDELLAKL